MSLTADDVSILPPAASRERFRAGLATPTAGWSAGYAYRTTIPTERAGRFEGPVVVSMRPIPAARVADAVRITSRYPAVHGAPVHVGDPAAIGIADLARPDFGEAVDIAEGTIPVFWACGVTPQAAVMQVRPELAITHAPGHMLVTDLRDSEFQVP